MLALLAVTPLILSFQATQASIAGAVRSADGGEPIAAAVVSLPQLDRHARVDADGRYFIGDIPAGPWHLTVRAIGYAPRTVHALVPRAGRLEVDVALLRVPHRLAFVEVRPAIPVRGAEDGVPAAFPNRSVLSGAISAHPLLTEPDVLAALGGGEVVIQPEAPSGLHVRGGAADQTAYLLDGIPVFSPYHAAGVFSAWNPDAISSISLNATGSSSPAHALSGTVSAVTRDARDRVHGQGSVGTSQARFTLDGPLDVAGASYLLSVRSSAPAHLFRRSEGSYLRSEATDWIAKLELPVFGGRLRAIGYASDDEISAAAAIGTEGSADGTQRNLFEWFGRSSGVEWRRTYGATTARIGGWRAQGGANARWGGLAGVPLRELAAQRHDEGLTAVAERATPSATSAAGLLLEQSRTAYRVNGDSQAPLWTRAGRMPSVSVFGRHSQALGNHTRWDIGTSLVAAAGDVHASPHAGLRWQPLQPLIVTANYARMHQFAQSLRNAESIVAGVFPADLFVNAAVSESPVARSDVGIIGVETRPSAGVRIGLQAYERAARGLLLVAPLDGEPFSTGAFMTGRSASRGAAFEASVSSTRAAWLASYGLQRVTVTSNRASHVPQHGTAQLAEGGVTAFPTKTSSVRVGVSGGWGRRTTAVLGEVEWEACNLRDQGCEFGGSPQSSTGALGRTRLPAYFRVDVGARRHWHVAVNGRDVELELFGAMTNVLNRRNVLTRAIHPTTGAMTDIEMRPQAPLVLGLDWRF